MLTAFRTRYRRAADGLTRLAHPELRHAFRVQSHLTARERVVLSRLAATGRIICEIGSYVGASACCFGAGLRRAGEGRILCIDTWNNDAMTEGSRDTYGEFKANIRPYADLVVPVRGFSTAVVDEVARHTQSIDLLFIDGDHSYEGAKADWEAYRPFLREGSVVVMHDYGWATGVQKLVRESIEPLAVSIDRLPNMWWGRLRAVGC